jgi:hypothetical protein
VRKGRFTEEQIIKFEGTRCWAFGQRYVPEARHQQCDVLQVAVALWRDEDLRCPEAEGAGGGEPQAQEAPGRVDAGCVDAKDARKNF